MIDGVVGILARWDWAARPVAIVGVPSLDDPAHDDLLVDLTDRVGALGRLPVIEALVRRDGPAQSAMANSAHKADNALRRLARTPAPLPEGPLLAVTVAVESGWTVTSAAWHLTSDGQRTILPLALTMGP